MVHQLVQRSDLGKISSILLHSSNLLAPKSVLKLTLKTRSHLQLRQSRWSCKLTYDAFQSFSNAVVFAIFENICIRITEEYRALRKIPASSEAQREFIRKQSKPTSTTAKHYKPLLDTLLSQLELVIRRNIIPKTAVVVIPKEARDIGLSQILQPLNRIIAQTISLRTLMSDGTLFATEFIHPKGSTVSDNLRKATPDFLVLIKVIKQLEDQAPLHSISDMVERYRWATWFQGMTYNEMDRTQIATSNLSYLVILKQLTMAHIAKHCILRLCKTRRSYGK